MDKKEAPEYKFFRIPGHGIIIPYNLFGYYNETFEINGVIVSKSSGDFIVDGDLKTIRRVSITRYTRGWQNGEGNFLTDTEYQAKLMKLREHRITVSEGGEDSCPQYTWDDKEAMFEEHLLTRTYTRVEEAIESFGEYLKFEIIDVPTSEDKHIKPLWKTDSTINELFVLDRRAAFDALMEYYKGQWPNIKVYTYTHDMDFSLNSTMYRAGNEKQFRGTYPQCVNAKNAIMETIYGAYQIELHKNDKPAVS